MNTDDSRLTLFGLLLLKIETYNEYVIGPVNDSISEGPLYKGDYTKDDFTEGFFTERDEKIGESHKYMINNFIENFYNKNKDFILNELIYYPDIKEFGSLPYNLKHIGKNKDLGIRYVGFHKHILSVMLLDSFRNIDIFLEFCNKHKIPEIHLADILINLLKFDKNGILADYSNKLHFEILIKAFNKMGNEPDKYSCILQDLDSSYDCVKNLMKKNPMKLMSPEYYSDICKLILKDNSILDDIYFYDFLTSNSTNYRCRPYDSSFNQDQ